jgi:hypothetical protein
MVDMSYKKDSIILYVVCVIIDLYNYKRVIYITHKIIKKTEINDS